MKPQNYAFLAILFILLVLVPGEMADTGNGLESQLLQTHYPQVVSTSFSHSDVLTCNPTGMFVENIGQFDDDVRFQLWGDTCILWFTEDSLRFTFTETVPASSTEDSNITNTEEIRPLNSNLSKPKNIIGENLILSFVGANSSPTIEPFEERETHFSYFYGQDKSRWHPDVPVWAGVRYADLYPGIDLMVANEPFSPFQWWLEANDKSDLSKVRIRIEGAQEIRLEKSSTLSGNAVIKVISKVGEYELPLLSIAGENIPVLTKANMRPTIIGDELVTPFNYGSYEKSSQLVVEADNPDDLIFSTYLGGSNDDRANSIAVDSQGHTYVTGQTLSSNFPTTYGAFDRYISGWDAYVVKLDPTGNYLAYATFIGGASGNHTENAYGIAVDSGGNAYITGYTLSTNFPTTYGAYNRYYNGHTDAFVTKLNPTGSYLIYSTYLGGYDPEGGSSIAVDTAGSAYVTGHTWSSDFPTTSGAADRSYNGNTDIFIAKIEPFGSHLSYATFLGGSGFDCFFNCYIAVDTEGSAYVHGYASSDDFPTTFGAYDTSHNGSNDAFVTKVNSTGTQYVYSTFLGGSGYEKPYGIAVDLAGSAYVSGETNSSDFPTTVGAFDRTYNGGYEDTYVAKINPGGSELVYATYLGGTGSDYNRDIAVDNSGNSYVTGHTSSSDFPTTPGAFDTSNYSYDGYVTKLNSAGNALIYSTFLRARSIESINIDDTCNAYVTGTSSGSLPTTSGAFDRSYNGSGDAFVAKFSLGGESPYSISGQISDQDGNPISAVTISADNGSSAVSDTNGDYVITCLESGTYQITPNSQSHVFIPRFREVTLPLSATGIDFLALEVMGDFDEDGLLNSWEVNGYEHDGVFVNLPVMGADPQIPDIFVEIDYMDDPGHCIFGVCVGGHSHQPTQQLIDMVVEAFDQQGTHLHVDYGEEALLHPSAQTDQLTQWRDIPGGSGANSLLERENILSGPPVASPSWRWYETTKVANLWPERFQTFNYAMFGHGLVGAEPDTLGLAPGSPGSELLVGMRDDRDLFYTAAVFMHELGHTINLCHSGPRQLVGEPRESGQLDCPNFDIVPNLFSIMSYAYTRTGLVTSSGRFLDYSDSTRLSNGLSEATLAELIGLDQPALDEYKVNWCFYNVVGQPFNRVFDANGWIDWNCDFLPDLDVVQVDITRDGDTDDFVSTYDEWANARLGNGCVGPGGTCFGSPMQTAPSIQALNFPGSDSPFIYLDTDPPFPEVILDHDISTEVATFVVTNPSANFAIPLTITNTGSLTSTVSFYETINSAWFDISNLPSQLVLQSGSSATYDLFLNVPSNGITGDEEVLELLLNVEEDDASSEVLRFKIIIGPYSWFSVVNNIGRIPLTVEFTDISVGDIDTWHWNFGDGKASTEQNPTHLYTTPGIYNVSLTVTGPEGSDRYTRISLVRAEPFRIFLPIVTR